ncbi:nucleoside triphosphate pyrophosphohydrolase [Desulfotomaculum copahuensis]|uniref:Nucleoside triphosphate pyrophosphohydrolase n=1 Tax=Desulfotomaculum copahuensis TaxID=1838280 RepID=A0A1B7LCV6_9FIRM|nr:nucleoside triphosphate pyrophosphohydrolase [Desulfotomaculum copahuensis]OAT80704.1 nucleoside triphosphate pyrophosphohydrolase [Desulfotomaculum copahuensis]
MSTPEIIIAGLGPGAPEQLPLAVWQVLQQDRPVFLRTERHPVVPWLRERGIVFETFDHFYETSRDFQEVYRRIAAALLAAAAAKPLIYAVPGHPLVAETAASLIMREAPAHGLGVKVLPAMSFLDALYVALRLDPAAGLHLVDGLRLAEQPPVPRVGNIVFQVYNRLVASDVKLSLMEYYPEEHTVTVVRAAGVPGEEKVQQCPLYTLDRIDWLDHLTSVYLPPAVDKPACKYPLDPLVDVLATLRGENGCPWDREQTHHSLIKYLLEETYEVVEALEQEDMYKVCEELGDLLLQIVFHAQLAREKGAFDMNSVVDGITKKMLRRHPHVFGDVQVKNSAEVLVNWEQIKSRERKGQNRKSLLDQAGRHLPALLRAGDIQARAAKAGFDWPDYRGAMDKVREELREVESAIAAGQALDVEREIGDLLFAVVNAARLLDVEAEAALTGTVDRFRRRFRHIEAEASRAGRELTECSLDELDAWWEEAKKLEKGEKMQE